MDAPVFPCGEFGKSKGVNFEMERLRYDGAGVGARTLAIMLMAVAVALLNTNAHGGLILGPNQLGTKQTISKNGAIEINPSGFKGLFFGQNVSSFGQNNSSIWLAENGYMSLTAPSGSDVISQSLAANTTPLIANFWDDISLFTGSPEVGSHHGIFLSHQQGQYLAATWSQVYLFNDLIGGEPITSQRSGSFQTIWFEADTNLANFQFKKDDIAMGFSGLSAASIDATVGIRDKSQFFTIDDVTGRDRGLAPGGLISTNPDNSGLDNADLLPWADDKILLFRPELDTTGQFSHYRVSIEKITAIPEPSSFVLFGAGACFLWWLRRKGRRTRHATLFAQK
ncbi:MAG: PEP-CTERM sorting domain-containing protein [Pirellula sp.]|jgi:hypothetical protein|nr:PEP-CTERM sorting domain-containing protein [Pirellula sp.]